MNSAIWISVAINFYFLLILLIELIAFGRIFVVKNKFMTLWELFLQFLAFIGLIYYILGYCDTSGT